jgi:hypothetical protein
LYDANNVVCRGGAWTGALENLHAEIRHVTTDPTHEANGFGFRVATFADCNDNGIPDECDLDCGATVGVGGGSCNVVYPGCGGSPDLNGNGIPDECVPDIPTVSEWGLVAMALLVLSAGMAVMVRRRVVGTPMNS